MIGLFKNKKKKAQAVLPATIEPEPERRVDDAGEPQEKRILPGYGEVWVNLPQEE